tara:strand:- start:226 stop:720 length:495 start_codon:yes stop_codon:yes gene_type:complete
MINTYWLISLNEENYNITKNLGFTIQGFNSFEKRKVSRMKPDDRIVYYLNDVKGFVATASVTSDPFEDETKYWFNSNEEESFKDRIEINPISILESKNYIDGNIVGPSLEYIKRWRPEKWYLSFYGMLHIIPQNDYRYLEKSIESNSPKSFRGKKSKKIRRLTR